MAAEEKSAWIMGFLAIVVYPVYLIWVLSGVGDGPLTEAPYAWPMLFTIGGSIVLSIILHIFFAPQIGKKDQREREILVKALRETGFNRTAAAQRLGLSLRQIRYRIARLAIATPGSEDADDTAG